MNIIILVIFVQKLSKIDPLKEIQEFISKNQPENVVFIFLKIEK